ncbi:single-stranded-DNA-specific exonuclease RecJ [Prevotella histicola]|jgi:single-stranded-DNA-specific exonuclease recJ|uniref:Single-stranded-DNA-specific exonuclease RecJ n=1 Tax=Prevotella histicola F0411 TaxID=857291 RepID=G6AFF9_9BACT|nr:single-stranded-DNA-specific exonuclease RecJ [Prevotella histicola]EHG16636.1 single-stranded-DNA-specific exonuclease RecJ [Prevotella histicola F0411]MBF1399451.1 single-stranded-DNA-specific exonuclease RecJ [Prevotella histicola]MBF1401383.1 single-stranded-DNA-specific exonuclease RecJ [Prevotella histicola]MBF1408814.1 single-stranded-DNA-specific exonuclease RecJ [Prevotella histicola]MBF1410717.1 single-stranded-DNA-specific exonuclease RecJ [Prevotella histicola]
MHFKWNYTPPAAEQENAAKDLGEKLGINPILASLLIRRGITTESAAKRFFRPQLADLINPFLMKDMDAAVDRLNDAMGHKERILVYGDYDVDGCTAVALVYKFLRQFYSNIDYYIPDRYDEGYGVSKKGIDFAKETGVKLIIILDCGIKAIEEITYAKEQGIDFIICDHHVPDEVMPPAVAILNPKRPDDSYPFKELCGCGVGFKFMQAFAKNNNIPFSRLVPLLDFCAVSIAADLVPVTDENRILAFHGLKQLNQNPNLGLKAIIDICGLNGRELSMSDIIFKIGPRINASGRMENGKKSVDLLVEREYAIALKEAKHIDEYNEQRKDVDRQMTEEANQIVARLESQKHHSSIVLYDEHWKKGVIGIVASRLTEIYFRPTVVLTRDDNLATGSARSVAGFDVYSAIKSCRDLLLNFGGHTYAAGLTMKWADVKEFRKRFQAYVEEHIQPEQREAILDIDAVVDFKDITKKLHSDLKRFAPFGPGNPKPIFCTLDVYDFGTSKVVGREQEHIKLELVDSKSNNVMNGIAFGQSASARYIKSKRSFDIAYTIEDNVFKRGAIQLQIEDIRPTEES